MNQATTPTLALRLFCLSKTSSSDTAPVEIIDGYQKIFRKTMLMLVW
jgi:hypothetical protein